MCSLHPLRLNRLVLGAVLIVLVLASVSWSVIDAYREKAQGEGYSLVETERTKAEPSERGLPSIPIGGRYEGEFFEGQRPGWAVLTLPNGERYGIEVRDGQEFDRGIRAAP